MERKRERVLVSACLLGVNCRYDGKSGEQEPVLELLKEYELVPVCPEQLGGMETPREPSECQAADGAEGVRVRNKKGEDVTGFFVKGAKEALKIAELYGCRYAILKERSPSCGSGIIYDGSFTGTKVPGYGVTARLLTGHGIKVVGESRISDLLSEISGDMMEGSIKLTEE